MGFIHFDIRLVRCWLCICILLGAALLGCGSKDPVLIGFVGGTSGRVADLGISGRDAVQLAVEACNRAGGIGGRPVQLLIRNDEQNPDLARRAVKDLIEQGVVAIVGPMTSDMAMAVAPLLNEAQVVSVSPTATTQKLSGLDDYFLRVSSTTREYAGKSARYHVKTGTMRRVAATYALSNRSFCENWLENFAAIFTEHDGEIIATIGFAADEGRSFLDVARELLADRPDGILIVANSMDSALFCQQIRKLDAAIPITLADWGATERLLELGGNAVEGVTVVQTFDRDSPAPRYQEFRTAYLDRYQREPGFPGVYSHDAIQVVLTALRNQKETQNLKETILGIKTFEGLQGPINIDQFGDVKRSNASISIVRNRKFVVVE
jgi:branched-chain amino acid transport system substrate-binding protein